MGNSSDRRSKQRESDDDGKDLFATYTEYNKTLRTWFVTFGLGAPALFLTNSTLSETLKASGNARIVIFSFLIGCAAQVGVALINKIAAWYNYDSERVSEEDQKKWRYRFSSWISNNFGSTSFVKLRRFCFLEERYGICSLPSYL
jgi:hypothetical protein